MSSTKSTGVWVSLSKSVFRTYQWMEKNPKRFLVYGCAVVGLVMSYEAIVEHQNRVPSPLVANHLEYEMRTNGALPRLGIRTKDDASRERSEQKEATMVVRRTQLEDRQGHWQIRNSERNWSIMARDMQKQKDNFQYRSLRSQDDDYLRNVHEPMKK